MRTVPIVPCDVERTDNGVPSLPRAGDVHHPRVGAAAQARHVFLAGNGLPARWQGRDTFTIVETGFGLGHNFLVAWDAWHGDPQRPSRLAFVSVELHPPTRDVLAAVHRDSPFGPRAAQLVAAWPPSTPDLHRIAFDGGRVELLLAFGDAAAWLRELEVAADAFFLDGFSPARHPAAWDAPLCKALGRLAAPGATLATWTAAHAVRERLAAAGFDVRLGAGTGGERDITLARFEPVHTPPPVARRAASPPAERRALIVGGGLAGAATAAALAERGWRSTVLERRDALAAEASGNPAGLFHGTVHADDGVHARFARAAALTVVGAVDSAIAGHGVLGAASGLLRIEPRLGLPAMQALLAGWPAAYVEAVDAETASRLAGVPLSWPAWHFPRGGWVDPAGIVRAYAARADDRLQVRTGVEVAAIRSSGGLWQALDAHGVPIDAAGTLVLANAGEALRLLGGPHWPVERVRGQISLLHRGSISARLAGSRLPVAGSGYLIPTQGGLLFGATRQSGDDDAAVRGADHAQNVARLEALVGSRLGIDLASLGGRTAWRCVARDRLPLVGAVPELAILRGERAFESRWDQPRHIPREPGLFVFTALGARGIATSALGAQVLAAGIAGTAVPLASSLIDAIDPARFVSRAARRAQAGSASVR